jgi:hypothetical protein
MLEVLGNRCCLHVGTVCCMKVAGYIVVDWDGKRRGVVPQHEGRNLQRVRVAWRSEEYEYRKGEFQKVNVI